MKRKALVEPLPWQGNELAATHSWRYALSCADVAELEAALAACPSRGAIPVPGDAFPLPGLAKVFASIRHELIAGTGVAKLTGLPVERYTLDELATLFLGLGSHLGRPTDQNGARGYLRSIRDQSARGGRRVDSADALNWHNDRTDIVGLLCVREAASGGISKIASATAIHNKMLEQCPTLLDVLFQDFDRYAPGDEVGGTAGRHALPVFSLTEGRLSTHFSRTYIEQATHLPGAAPLSDAQQQALDTLIATAEALRYEMRLARGEIQFLNNHAILHGRSAFTDDPSRGEERLLLRIWLATTNRGEWRA